jgi:prolyl-tRNA editing enzyme YbaK/EbsC (Cys-tRNA(Pro) deacylase)
MSEKDRLTLYIRLTEDESQQVEHAARYHKSPHQWAKSIIMREAAKEIVPLAEVDRLLAELGFNEKERREQLDQLRNT